MWRIKNTYFNLNQGHTNEIKWCPCLLHDTSQKCPSSKIIGTEDTCEWDICPKAPLYLVSRRSIQCTLVWIGFRKCTVIQQELTANKQPFLIQIKACWWIQQGEIRCNWIWPSHSAPQSPKYNYSSAASYSNGVRLYWHSAAAPQGLILTWLFCVCCVLTHGSQQIGGVDLTLKKFRLSICCYTSLSFFRCFSFHLWWVCIS